MSDPIKRPSWWEDPPEDPPEDMDSDVPMQEVSETEIEIDKERYIGPVEDRDCDYWNRIK